MGGENENVDIHHVTSLWARFHITVTHLHPEAGGLILKRARHHLPRPKIQIAEHTPFEFMLDDVRNNSSTFRECVSEALIKRSLAEPKKQPRRRATSAAHKRASKSLEYNDEEAFDLAEFAEVRLVR